MDGLHMLNFIETIRGTADLQHQPIDEGAKSTLLGHLANIAYRTESTLEIDGGTGHILNNPAALELWSRTYEKGWEPAS